MTRDRAHRPSVGRQHAHLGGLCARALASPPSRPSGGVEQALHGLAGAVQVAAVELRLLAARRDAYVAGSGSGPPPPGRARAGPGVGDRRGPGDQRAPLVPP